MLLGRYLRLHWYLTTAWLSKEQAESHRSSPSSLTRLPLPVQRPAQRQLLACCLTMRTSRLLRQTGSRQELRRSKKIQLRRMLSLLGQAHRLLGPAHRFLSPAHRFLGPRRRVLISRDGEASTLATSRQPSVTSINGMLAQLGHEQAQIAI